MRKLRVIHALMLREMITRYGISKLGYLWALLEPVAIIALLTLLFSQVTRGPALGTSFPLFFATGYVAFHWFHDISTVVARSAWVNRPLFLFSVVTPLDTVIARFLLQVLTAISVGTVIMAGILAFAPDRVVLAPAAFLSAFSLAALLGLSVGLFNVWAMALSRSWELCWNLVSRPLLLVSCVFYSFWSVPAALRDLLWWNPIVHVVGLFRAGFYPGQDSSHVSAAYVGAISAALAVTGLMGLRLSQAKVVGA